MAKIKRIAGPLVVASPARDFKLNEVVLVGEEKLWGEVVRVQGEDAFIQVYEETSGLRVGEPVERTLGYLGLTLGPGLLGSVFDGVQRPLRQLDLRSPRPGFVTRGIHVLPLSPYVPWNWHPGGEGSELRLGDPVGYVWEAAREHWIQIPPAIRHQYWLLAGQRAWGIRFVKAERGRLGDFAWLLAKRVLDLGGREVEEKPLDEILGGYIAEEVVKEFGDPLRVPVSEAELGAFMSLNLLQGIPAIMRFAPAERQSEFLAGLEKKVKAFLEDEIDNDYERRNDYALTLMLVGAWLSFGEKPLGRDFLSGLFKAAARIEAGIKAYFKWDKLSSYIVRLAMMRGLARRWSEMRGKFARAKDGLAVYARAVEEISSEAEERMAEALSWLGVEAPDWVKEDILRDWEVIASDARRGVDAIPEEVQISEDEIEAAARELASTDALPDELSPAEFRVSPIAQESLGGIVSISNGVRLFQIGGAFVGTSAMAHMDPELLKREFSKPFKLTKVLKDDPWVSVYQVVAVVEDDEEYYPITPAQPWPARVARPVHPEKKKALPSEPLITGQRVLDFLFPVAKGGNAAIPGGFGTGKTVTEQTLAKYAQVDVVIYIGCGERGNEMAEVLAEFPHLEDPTRPGHPLMDRTILVVNTSNMPVVAREASIYTGITLAEYYRDLGYDVLLLADSTSRWAEALREMSSRLEEMPGEEGYPTYLASRLAAFYERTGVAHLLGSTERKGSVTAVGAVSPQGSDFSEPVTQSTLRVVGAFWALDQDLARRRHYPAINWLMSYTLYYGLIGNWFDERYPDWSELRRWASEMLQRDAELNEIVSLVGPDALEDLDRVALETGRLIREAFLQQNAFHEVDASCSLKKQHLIMSSIRRFYELATEAVRAKRIGAEELRTLPEVERIVRLKELPDPEAEREAAEALKALEERLK